MARRSSRPRPTSSRPRSSTSRCRATARCGCCARPALVRTTTWPPTCRSSGLLPHDADELELARAYAAGVDDIARQPVGYVELRCRLESLLHRAQPVRAQG